MDSQERRCLTLPSVSSMEWKKECAERIRKISHGGNKVQQVPRKISELPNRELGNVHILGRGSKESSGKSFWGSVKLRTKQWNNRKHKRLNNAFPVVKTIVRFRKSLRISAGSRNNCRFISRILHFFSPLFSSRSPKSQIESRIPISLSLFSIFWYRKKIFPGQCINILFSRCDFLSERWTSGNLNLPVSTLTLSQTRVRVIMSHSAQGTLNKTGYYSPIKRSIKWAIDWHVASIPIREI